MGIDIWEVIDAAATKPFGFTPFYPGPGGGALVFRSIPSTSPGRQKNMAYTPVSLSLRAKLTTQCPAHVFDRVNRALNEHGIALSNAKVLVLGIAYKKNVDDMRESPAVKLMELIRSSGARLCYHDPFVPTFPKMREHSFDLKSIPLEEALPIRIAQCLSLTMMFSSTESIRRNSKILVDSRGPYRGQFENVIRA